MFVDHTLFTTAEATVTANFIQQVKDASTLLTRPHTGNVEDWIQALGGDPDLASPSRHWVLKDLEKCLKYDQAKGLPKKRFLHRYSGEVFGLQDQCYALRESRVTA